MEDELRDRILRALDENVMIGTGSRDEKKKATEKKRQLSEWQKCQKRYGREGAKLHYKKDNKKCNKNTNANMEKMREGAAAYRERYKRFRDEGYSIKESREMAKSKVKPDMQQLNENVMLGSGSKQISEMLYKIVHILDHELVRDMSLEDKINFLHSLVFDKKHGGALVGGKHGVGMRKFKNTMKDILHIGRTVAPLLPLIL